MEETAGAVTVLQPANTTSATITARATARPSVSLPNLVFTTLASLATNDLSFRRTASSTIDQTYSVG
jgi:hypothetical protein